MIHTAAIRRAGAVAAMVLAAAMASRALPAQAPAHRQPATVPTAVAVAMTTTTSPFDAPRYFNGATPTGWPGALVPAGATVVGGGALGDSLTFRVRVAVFDIGADANAAEVGRDVMRKAGFVPGPREGGPNEGGFVATEPGERVGPYCNGSAAALFSVVDSAQSPSVVSIHLLDGPGGWSACGPRRAPNPSGQALITIPTMSPPRGGVLQPGGSSSNDERGQVRATLRTTMPADSVLAHFSAQLVAGGWLLDGSPALGEGVSAQRFFVREGKDGWTAALIVLRVEDRHEIRLEYARRM